MESFRKNLMKLHDELADLKSYFDGHRSDQSWEDKSFGRIYILYYSMQIPWSKITTIRFDNFLESPPITQEDPEPSDGDPED